MDLRSALKVLARHWVLVAAAMVATAPVARAVGEQVDPVYEAEEKLLFLGPSHIWTSEGRRIDVNPFASNGLAEQLAASMMATVTNTPWWMDRIEDQGAAADVSYRRVTEVIVEVRASALSGDEALGSLAIAVRALSEELAARQRLAGAPEESWIYVDPLLEPEAATVVLGSKIKATAGIGLLGIGVAATLAFLAEALGLGGRKRVSRWLRRRRGGHHAWHRPLTVAYQRWRTRHGLDPAPLEWGDDYDAAASDDDEPALSAPWR